MKKDALNEYMYHLLINSGYSQDNPVPHYKPIRIDDLVFIFGECHGVLLHKRAFNDNHILVELLCDDDGNWSISSSLGSSAWHDDFQKVMDCLSEYYVKECVPYFYEGIQYGYNFK